MVANKIVSYLITISYLSTLVRLLEIMFTGLQLGQCFLVDISGSDRLSIQECSVKKLTNYQWYIPVVQLN